MPKRRTTRPRASRSISKAVACATEASRVMRDQSALALAAQRIITARTSTIDAGELMRMVPEKAIAFTAAGMTALQQATNIGLQFGPTSWMSLLSARNPWEFWQRSVTQGFALSSAMMRAQMAAMAPVRDATQRNTRRLGL